MTEMLNCYQINVCVSAKRFSQERVAYLVATLEAQERFWFYLAFLSWEGFGFVVRRF